jgi:hypothetical protein
MIVALFALIITSAQAQDFNNTGGSYKGQGKFRVKNQAIGLPDTVTGTFEYFGGNQQVGAKNYENLLLTGNGSTKQTTPSDVNIIHSVAVADGVRFEVASEMTLEKITGRISTENGLIIGKVSKTVDLNVPSDSSDFGGIGISIRSNGSALGTTDILRTSGSSVTGYTGNQSIQRLYEINPSNINGINGTMYFHYAKDELAGNDSTTLDIWRSPDNGVTWRRQHTSRNGNTLVRTGGFLKGVWTASSANNLIGRTNYEFDPDSILAVSSDSAKGKVNKQLDSLFIAQITDVYGNPIAGARVLFSITQTPDSATGQNLSNTSAITDSLGTVSTQLRLGCRSGRYVVLAQVESVPAAQIAFYGYGASGINKLDCKPAPVQDTIKQIIGPFIVEAFDELNSSVAYTGVHFSVTPPPGSGATQQGITLADTITDGSGRASAMVRLGEKVGVYTIEARSIENETIIASFPVQVAHGIPALAWKDNNDNIVRQDTIGALMQQFTYAITDGDTNAVSARTIRFVLMRPDSSIADSAFVTTDSFGQAKVSTFRYGMTAGTYLVSAQDTNLVGSERFFICTALRGLPRILAQRSGNEQVGQVGDLLQPFVVQVTDAGGNSVPNVQVCFTIIGRPDALTKLDSLTVDTTATDVSGQAYTALTLGNRPGRYTVKASIAGVKDTTFAAYALMLLADVNHDNYRNIGDLTAMIDHAIGRNILTGFNYNKADMYPANVNGITGDGLVDIRDVQVCLDSLLSAGWDPMRDWMSTPMAPLFKIDGASSLTGLSALPMSLTDSIYIQATHIGTRFMLKNTLQIKGLQAVIYMKNPATLDTTDIIFPRAKMMTAEVKSVGNEVSVILWNYTNTPIEVGDSAIFRLPIQLTNNNVDSINVLVSTGTNNVVSLLASKQEDVRSSIPRDWMLYQNYPNPFNPSTTIDFDVPEITGKIPRVAVQIFNILGQKVRTIERGIHDAGRYSVTWNGASDNGARVASGVYFYRLLAGDYATTKKMVMLK